MTLNDSTAKSRPSYDCLITTKEAPRLLAVSDAFLERDRWAGAHNGKGALIPFVKVGARVLIAPLSLGASSH